MSWAYDEGGGYSLLDADGNEVPSLVDAIVKPYPAAVAGTLESWSYDPVARTLDVQMKRDPSITAPTVIIAPARVYPDGVTVDCGGCTVETVGNQLRLTGGDGPVHVAPRS
jgi:endoglycosylceramidase